MKTLGGLLAWLCVATTPLTVDAARTSSIVLTPDETAVCAVNQDSRSISVWNWSGNGQRARQGKMALWAFETWTEFDNVKPTRLVPVP